MATIAISALPVATAASTTDVLPIVQGGTTKQVTNALLFTNATLVSPALGTPTALVGTNITGTAAGLTAGNVTTNANLTGAITSVGNAASLGSFTSAQLLAALTDETGTGANVFATSPTLVTPVIGAATGTSLSTTSNQLITGTGKQGYATGSGGTVTQLTDKSTAVTLNKSTGQITTSNAALAASTTVSFTLSNTLIEVDDILIMNHFSGGTAGSYLLNAQTAANSASINVRNISLGSLSEAIVISFAVIKAVRA
jgi:hypothetical protein